MVYNILCSSWLRDKFRLVRVQSVIPVLVFINLLLSILFYLFIILECDEFSKDFIQRRPIIDLLLMVYEQRISSCSCFGLELVQYHFRVFTPSYPLVVQLSTLLTHLCLDRLRCLDVFSSSTNFELKATVKRLRAHVQRYFPSIERIIQNTDLV